MSIFSTVAWKLMSDEKKLKKLRERGLTIGGGVRDSQRIQLRIRTVPR